MRLKVILAGIAICGLGSAADAGLTVCNSTDTKVSIAIGYNDAGTWTSEGWWNVEPNACKAVISRDLTNRHYYWHATSTGQTWDGEGFMFCSISDVFTIAGDENCESRGYKRTSFSDFELDKGTTQATLTLLPSGGAGKSVPAAAPEAARPPKNGAQASPAPAPVASAPPAPAQVASAPAAAGPPPGNQDPPGTHGEPFSVGGILGGCIFNDASFQCELSSGNFRYVALSGIQTPDALLEWMLDVPVNTPMGWVGDMISYTGNTAEVVLREATLEGSDPFAATRAGMQGYWTSRDDPKYQLLIAGNQFEEFYDNVPTDSRSVELSNSAPDSCEGPRGGGPYLIAHTYFAQEEPRCFAIDRADGRRLALWPVGGFNPLEFDAAGN